MKKIIFIGIFLMSSLSLLGCSEKNDFEKFVDNLREAKSFKADMTIEQEILNLDYYANMTFDNTYDTTMIYVETNYEKYNGNFYVEVIDDANAYVRYKDDDSWKFELIENTFIDENVRGNLNMDNFHLNEYGEYELNEELLTKYSFESATIEIVDSKEAVIECQYLINKVKVPVYIRVYAFNDCSVEIQL